MTTFVLSLQRYLPLMSWYVSMYVCMYMHEWTDGWMGGRMSGQMDKQTMDGCMYACFTEHFRYNSKVQRCIYVYIFLLYVNVNTCALIHSNHCK